MQALNTLLLCSIKGKLNTNHLKIKWKETAAELMMTISVDLCLHQFLNVSSNMAKFNKCWYFQLHFSISYWPCLFPPPNTNKNRDLVFWVLQVSAFLFEYKSKMLENLLDLKKKNKTKNFLDKSRVVWLIIRCHSFISPVASHLVFLLFHFNKILPHLILLQLIWGLWFISGSDEMQKVPLCWEIK